MKKLIIALGAIAVAVVGHAAAVDWSASINGAATAGIDATKYMAYFVDNSTWSTVWTAGDGAGTLKGDALTGALDSASFALSGTKATTGTQSFTTSAASVPYKVVLVETAANKWAILGEGTAMSYDPESSSGTAAAVSTTGAKVLGTASSGNLTWGTVSVPEPTSGLLMLLGMAGLALRRRRA